jgi:hypothetical protein
VGWRLIVADDPPSSDILRRAVREISAPDEKSVFRPRRPLADDFRTSENAGRQEKSLAPSPKVSGKTAGKRPNGATPKNRVRTSPGLRVNKVLFSTNGGPRNRTCFTPTTLSVVRSRCVACVRRGGRPSVEQVVEHQIKAWKIRVDCAKVTCVCL